MVGSLSIARRALVLCAALFALLAGVAHAAPTVVTLTFDDGVGDQWTARTSSRATGSTRRFYINSSRPGKSRFMSWDQLHQLAADGNEIGGHTIDHVNLPSLGPDDQKREICNDRADLLAHNFQVTDFAFPFGSHDAASEAVAQECGYNSAPHHLRHRVAARLRRLPPRRELHAA